MDRAGWWKSRIRRENSSNPQVRASAFPERRPAQVPPLTSCINQLEKHWIAIISSVTVVLALRVNFGVPPDTTLQILSINKEARGRATPIVNFSLIRNPSERGRKIRQYKFHSLCKRKGFGQTLYHLYVSLQLHPGGKGETRKIVLKDSH